MNATWKMLATLMVLAAGVAMEVRGDSIWARANGRTRSVYCDDTARGLGDNLTIVINEISKIDNTSKRSMEKQDQRTATMSGSVKGNDVTPMWLNKTFNIPTVNASSNSDTKFDGKADYNASRSLTDQITVTVQDVLPNGNLVVIGKREREIAGDKQIIQASGIVRPSDIAFDNTISSDKIANFQIAVKNKGQESEFTNPGWLARILNFFNPM